MLRQYQDEIIIATHGQALIDITRKVAGDVAASGIATGQATAFVQHTSASLLVQENASPAVRRDLIAFFNRLVPEGASYLTHIDEGPDDMPPASKRR